MDSIVRVEVTPFQQNCRILVDRTNSVCAVVDPGGDVNLVLNALKKVAGEVCYLFLTHAHLDHVGGTARLLAALNNQQERQVKVIAHQAEAEMRRSISQQALMFGFSAKEFQDVPDVDIVVDGNEEFELGDFLIKVIHTPGHSPGHIALFVTHKVAGNGFSPYLFSGDALFAGSIGRTDLPGGSYETLLRSIRHKLLVLPEETVVMAGHGPDSDIGTEKMYNPFLQGESV